MLPDVIITVRGNTKIWITILNRTIANPVLHSPGLQMAVIISPKTSLVTILSVKLSSVYVQQIAYRKFRIIALIMHFQQ